MRPRVVLFRGWSRRTRHVVARFALLEVAYLVAAVLAWAMLALTVATSGILTCFPIFWTLPSEFLSGVAVAAAIGLINSTGNLGGFASPYLIGVIKDATHSTAPGLYVIAAGMALGGIIVLARKRAMTSTSGPDIVSD